MAVRLIGRLIRSIRAGIDSIAWCNPATASAPDSITISSDAFADGGPMPRRFAGNGVGDDISPDLRFSGVPVGTVELVLVIEDPDVPLPRPIVHGLFSGISATTSGIPEGALNLGANSDVMPTIDSRIRFGVGAFKRRGYAGPRPISGHGAHRYVFQLFALDKVSGLDENSTLADTMTAIDGHVIARGMLIGTYERP
ncbi:YbhB/YbcL family Raf kinase inhibitor-like protein [Nocardia vaccinii]|uniref:YbhB/YbcL family Raf kinase inhibitor-like protein n=1 Tax=Nocardia vaccinii TaxID=1822 RepID=UPI00082EB191|nr:YbhB/YbcL family Raf kinase inhibitor-like protein [Nocardia vaccinii]